MEKECVFGCAKCRWRRVDGWPLLGAPKGFRMETGQCSGEDGGICRRGGRVKPMSEEILEKGSLAGRGPPPPPPPSSYMHMDKANGHNNGIATVPW